MGTSKRVRAVGSISNELVKKSLEAALAAVQVFNNPAVTFKSEIFVVLIVIAWTYLLHAHYRKSGIEYRYFKMAGKVRRFHKTKRGAYKYWELERCINERSCPVDLAAKNNLRFLIGLRHEIEHQMTSRLDEHLSARFQACCLNYNDAIKAMFGDEYGIDKHLSFSLQFSSITTEQVSALRDNEGLPANIEAFINAFDSELSETEFNDPRFSYRVLFIPKTVNHKGQADKVIEFIKSDSDLARGINQQYAVIKETEKKKYLPKQVVQKMSDEGYSKFRVHDHTLLWKSHNAKSSAQAFGAEVAEGPWYWYESWIDVVRDHCSNNASKYQ